MNVSDFCKKSTFPPIITEDLKERIKNLDKEVFFILSTARCRSTWFGNFFTYKDSFCWNEELRYCSCWEDIVDRIEKRPEKYIGFEDPELLHYITTLYELFPNAKYVLLERDRFECENSLKNIISLQGKVHPEILEGNYITRKFDRWYYDIHNMEKIHLYDKIISPLVTEKSTNLSEQNKVVFKVPAGADKVNLKKILNNCFHLILQFT